MVQITNKQQRILDFYKNYIEKKNYAPSYQEAAKMLSISPSVVFFHLKNLQKKGVIATSSKKRATKILSDLVKVPVVGAIACGEPIDVFENYEGYVNVTKDEVNNDQNLYALRAVGDSMIDIGVEDGDFLIIRKQDDLNDGEVGVVIVGDNPTDEKATLKRVYKKPNSLILKAENSNIPPMVYSQGSIRGKYITHIKK